MPPEAIAGAAASPRRLFYWCHNTFRQPFESGIQRVTRRLSRALAQTGIEVIPVGRDERSGLAEVIGHGPAAFDKLLAASRTRPVLFIPELTADLVGIGADPICIGRAYGMRTSILVHDLIPLKLRSHYSAEAFTAFTAYYAGFARADAVVATTEGVAGELRAFLDSRALRVPPIDVVALPAQFGDHPRLLDAPLARSGGTPLRLVSVGTWERRKNLPALLRAFGRARHAASDAMELTLVGRRGLDPAFDAEVSALITDTPGVVTAGSLDDRALAAWIAASDATIYPSWEEGFGLPIGESLWLGRPCICHNGSAMAEVAPGGGTLMIDMTDEAAIADTLVRLATQPELVGRLTEEIRHRPLLSWQDYAGAVADRLIGIADATWP